MAGKKYNVYLFHLHGMFLTYFEPRIEGLISLILVGCLMIPTQGHMVLEVPFHAPVTILAASY